MDLLHLVFVSFVVVTLVIVAVIGLGSVLSTFLLILIQPSDGPAEKQMMQKHNEYRARLREEGHKTFAD